MLNSWITSYPYSIFFQIYNKPKNKKLLKVLIIFYCIIFKIYKYINCINF